MSTNPPTPPPLLLTLKLNNFNLLEAAKLIDFSLKLSVNIYSSRDVNINTTLPWQPSFDSYVSKL